MLLPAISLMAIGVLFVWSTTHANATPLWGRQIAFIHDFKIHLHAL